MQRKQMRAWTAALRAADRGSVNIRAITRRKQARHILTSVFGMTVALVITALLALPHLKREPIEVAAPVFETAVPTPTATPKPTPPRKTEESREQHTDVLLVLVNGKTALPETFSLVTRSYGGVEVNALMYKDLCAMLDAAAEDGHTLWLASGYRSVELQTSVLEKAVQSRIKRGMTREAAEADARKTIQAPGYSEHHTGLAIDFNEVAYGFAESGAYAWLRAHAAEYGFVERYPEDKAAVTGIDYEPWHYRYVGRTHAVRMQALGLCLEEYIAYCTDRGI